MTTGNTGSTDTITLSLATKPTGGAFSSGSTTYTNVAAVNGTATFSPVALNNTAGSYTFTATDTQSGDTGVTSVTSTPATVITASHIALVGTPFERNHKERDVPDDQCPIGYDHRRCAVAQVTARDNLATAGVTSITAPTGWTVSTTLRTTGVRRSSSSPTRALLEAPVARRPVPLGPGHGRARTTAVAAGLSRTVAAGSSNSVASTRPPRSTSAGTVAREQGRLPRRRQRHHNSGER